MAKSSVLVRFLGDADGLKRTMGGINDGARKLAGVGIAAGAGMAALGVGAVAAGSMVLDLGGQLTAFRTKTSTVFEGSADDVRAWADANNEAFGLGKDQLAGLAAGFGDLLKPMGFTAEQAADMSTDVVGLSGALSEWSGGTRNAAEVTDILAKAMLGERDGLKELGISISEADVSARLAAKGQEDLTGAALEQAKAIATQELIMEKSTDAQKAYAAGGNEAMRASNTLKATIEDLKTKAVDALLPVVTKLAQWLGDNMPGMIARAEVAFARISVVVQQVAAVVQQHWPAISATIIAAVTAVWNAVSPIIGALQALWNNFGNNILQFVMRVWPAIRQIIVGTLTVIRGIIQTVTSLIRGDWAGVWNGIKAVVTGAWNVIQGVVKAALEAVRTIVGVGLEILGSMFKSAWNGIISFFRGVPGRISSIAGGMFDGIKSAFRSAINWIIGAWNGLEFRIPGFDPPGPGPKFGGFTLGVPNIPRLASGAVVNRPTLAWIGDGTGKNRTEIATPEALMRQIVREEGGGAGTVIIQGGVFLGTNQTDLERELVAILNRIDRKGTRG